MLSAKEVAGKWHAWWLESDWIGRREEAPKVDALGDIGRVDGFSQISGAPRAGRHRQLLSLIWWTGKIRVLVFPILPCVKFEIILTGSTQRFFTAGMRQQCELVPCERYSNSILFYL